MVKKLTFGDHPTEIAKTRAAFIKKYTLPKNIDLSKIDKLFALEHFMRSSSVVVKNGLPVLLIDVAEDATDLMSVFEKNADIMIYEAELIAGAEKPKQKITVPSEILDAVKLDAGAYIVRPADDKCGEMFSGAVIKVGTITATDDGEEWKTLIKDSAKKSGIEVGDVLFYSYKYDIVLGGEMLHYVGNYHLWMPNEF